MELLTGSLNYNALLDLEPTRAWISHAALRHSFPAEFGQLFPKQIGCVTTLGENISQPDSIEPNTHRHTEPSIAQAQLQVAQACLELLPGPRGSQAE
jgi:hypothetical protein